MFLPIVDLTFNEEVIGNDRYILIQNDNSGILEKDLQTISFENIQGLLPCAYVIKAKNHLIYYNVNNHVSIEKELYTPSSKAYLKVSKLADTYVDIDEREFFIGRASGGCNLTIENKTVGRIHSKIVFHNHNYYIIDLDSVNGTFINGERISSNQNIQLNSNDELMISDEVFVFISEQQAQN